MKLSKMLKLKNRLAGEVAKLKGLVPTLNVVEDNRHHEYDIEIKLEEMQVRLEELALLKTVIALANAGVAGVTEEMASRSQWYKIFLLAELRGLAEMLRSIPVKNGIFKEQIGFQGDAVEKNYVSFLNQVNIDSRVKDCERRIDDIQDAVDAYNAKTGNAVVDDIDIFAT